MAACAGYPRRVPSPLAHAGLALALRVVVARPGAPVLDRVALAAAVASLVPDLDMVLVVLLPGGLAWHHGPTHSLVGAALGGLATGLAFRLDRGGLWVATLAGLLHAPMDFLTGVPGAPARYGVPLFWPLLADRYISPWPWFPPFNIDREGFLWHMVSREALAVYAREGVTAAAALGLALLGRRRG